MPECEICGEEDDKLYTCTSCGAKFCEDCGSPAEKRCEFCEEEIDDDEDDEGFEDEPEEEDDE